MKSNLIIILLLNVLNCYSQIFIPNKAEGTFNFNLIKPDTGSLTLINDSSYTLYWNLSSYKFTHSEKGTYVYNNKTGILKTSPQIINNKSASKFKKEIIGAKAFRILLYNNVMYAFESKPPFKLVSSNDYFGSELDFINTLNSCDPDLISFTSNKTVKDTIKKTSKTHSKLILDTTLTCSIIKSKNYKKGTYWEIPSGLSFLHPYKDSIPKIKGFYKKLNYLVITTGRNDGFYRGQFLFDQNNKRYIVFEAKRKKSYIIPLYILDPNIDLYSLTLKTKNGC